MAMLLNQYYINSNEVLADHYAHNFYDFFKGFWHVMVPDEPFVFNWHIKYLCDQLQEAAERVFANEPNKYDLIINVPPGTTKSTIFSVAFCPWTWTRMPRARHICGSHTHELVLDLSRKCRDVIKSDQYKELYPHIQLREDQDTKGYWANNFGGYRFSCTVAGRTPTGFHGHFLIVDDPIDPKKSVSDVEIQSAADWMNRTLRTRKADKRITHTALVMQRLAEGDPSGDRLSNPKAGKVKHICLPCDDNWDIKPAYLKGRYKKRKGLLDPKRLPRKVLLGELAALGQYGYSGQYGQSPAPLTGGMFRVNELRIERISPIQFRRKVRYWDKAYTQDGGAYTVGVLMGLDMDNRFWILDVQRGQWESNEREKVIKQTARLDGIKVKIGVEQEPAAGKESARNTIKNLAGFRVVADIRGGVGDTNKILRADPYATQVNAGNVVLKEADWNRDYIQELRLFHKGKYKDQVDASSGAFNMLTRRRTVGAIVVEEAGREIPY